MAVAPCPITIASKIGLNVQADIEHRPRGDHQDASTVVSLDRRRLRLPVIAGLMAPAADARSKRKAEEPVHGLCDRREPLRLADDHRAGAHRRPGAARGAPARRHLDQCRRSCSETLRQETIDFWYIRSNPYMAAASGTGPAISASSGAGKAVAPTDAGGRRAAPPVPASARWRRGGRPIDQFGSNEGCAAGPV